MKSTKTILKAASIAALAPVFANAMWMNSGDQGYARIQGGAVFPMTKTNVHFENVDADFLVKDKHKTKTSGIFGLAVGQMVDQNVGIELEVNYMTNSKINRNQSSSQTRETTRDDGSTDTTNVSEYASARSKITSTTVFVNAKYNLLNDMEMFSPYVMAGLGVAFNKLNNVTFSENFVASTLNSASGSTPIPISGSSNELYKGKKKTNFAFQVGAGLNMPVSDGVEFSLSYRYMDLGKIRSSNYDMASKTTAAAPAVDTHLRSSVVMAGVTFKL